MEYVEKPTKGFNSPFQVLVLSLSEHMLKNSPKGFNEKWFEIWNCLDESECDLTKPVLVGDNRWMLTITSEKRGIAPTKIHFSPLNINTYFQQAILFNRKEYGLGHHVSEPGFYFSAGTKNPLLVVRRGSDITNGLRYQGCEIPKYAYSISAKGDNININCPVVKGEIPIVYI